MRAVFLGVGHGPPAKQFYVGVWFKSEPLAPSYGPWGMSVIDEFERSIFVSA